MGGGGSFLVGSTTGVSQAVPGVNERLSKKE